MDSLSGSSYRPNPDQWHWELRNFFLYYLVREPTYKAVVEKLGLYWKRVLENRPDLDPEAPYYLLPFHDVDPTKNPPDPLALYAFAVQLAVSGDLRCTEGSKPSVWVSHAIHAGVNGTALDIGHAPQHWLWVGELLIPIGSVGFAAVGGKINGHVITDFETVERQTIEQPHAGTPFNQWKKLKKLAHQEFDHLLEELQEQVEAKTADWPNMYQKGRKTRTQETMQKLVRWVVGREEQFDGDRTETYALLKELRLNPPGASKKFGQKS